MILCVFVVKISRLDQVVYTLGGRCDPQPFKSLFGIGLRPETMRNAGPELGSTSGKGQRRRPASYAGVSGLCDYFGLYRNRRAPVRHRFLH